MNVLPYMVDVSLAQKVSRFTLLMKTFNNSSFLVPVYLLPVSNRNIHMMHFIVVNREFSVLANWNIPWSITCIHLNPSSSNSLFKWKISSGWSLYNEGFHTILHTLLSRLIWQTFVQNIPSGSFTTFPHGTNLPLHLQKPLTSSPFPRPVISKRKSNYKG